MIVAVDYFAETGLATERFGQHQRVKGQQQPVVLGEFVGEDEANRDELGRFAPAFRGDAFDSVQTGLEIFGVYR